MTRVVTGDDGKVRVDLSDGGPVTSLRISVRSSAADAAPTLLTLDDFSDDTTAVPIRPPCRGSRAAPKLTKRHDRSMSKSTAHCLLIPSVIFIMDAFSSFSRRQPTANHPGTSDLYHDLNTVDVVYLSVLRICITGHHIDQVNLRTSVLPNSNLTAQIAYLYGPGDRSVWPIIRRPLGR